MLGASLTCTVMVSIIYPESHVTCSFVVFLQSQVLEFMWDIFSFSQVRYTSVELLAVDIMQLARERAAVATAHMSAISP